KLVMWPSSLRLANSFFWANSQTFTDLMLAVANDFWSGTIRSRIIIACPGLMSVVFLPAFKSQSQSWTLAGSYMSSSEAPETKVFPSREKPIPLIRRVWPCKVFLIFPVLASHRLIEWPTPPAMVLPSLEKTRQETLGVAL